MSRVKLNVVLTVCLALLFFLVAHAGAEDLYVLSRSSGKIFVFDSDDSGTVAPKREFSGVATTLTVNGIYGLFLSGGELFVSNESTDSILVFNAGDNGNVAPKRSISGANTGFSTPRDMFVIGTDLYVVDESGHSVKVFNKYDSGNVAPVREITGFLNDLYAAVVYGSELFVMDSTAKVSVFDRTATGTVAATVKRTIDLATLSGPRGLWIDNGIIYASDSNQISTFPVSSTGVVAPITTITGAATNLSDCHALFVKNGNIYSTNYSDASHAVQVFLVSDDGNVAPQRFLASAGLTYPLGIAMETETAATIPTLSEWGMIIFSILLGTIAIWTMNRRKEQMI